MRKTINDILNHTATTGLFEIIKIKGGNDATEILSTDPSRSVILNAKTNEAVEDFQGDFGLGALPYLKGLVNMSAFQSDDATVKINYREPELAESITFASAEGTNCTYRLMHSSIIPEFPVFKGQAATWNITVDVDANKVEEFSQLAALYNGMESNFILKEDKGDLMLYLGDEDSASHKAKMVFAANVDGTMGTSMAWPISNFITLLKLAKGKPATIRITDQGVINVEIGTEYATYQYYLMATQR